MESYFKDNRLFLSGFGESIVRITTYASYIFLVSACVVMFLSDIESLRWASLLLGFFLIDRVIRAGGGEKSIGDLQRLKNKNIALAFTPTSYRILSACLRRSLTTGEDIYFVLASELLKKREIHGVLARLNIDHREFREKITRFLEEGTEKRKKEELLKITNKIAEIAYENAVTTHEKFVEPRNIFSAVVSGGGMKMQKVMNLFNIVENDISEAIIFGRYSKFFSKLRRIPAFLGGLVYESRIIRKRVVNRAWTSRPTPILDEYSRDLTAMAKREKIGFLIGHKEEYEEILRVVSRPGKPNALLVGEAGSGKSTIVAHLALSMNKDNVPSVLFDKRLISLDITRLVSGAVQEELAGRIRKIVEEILLAGNIVLFIPDIHNLFKTSPTQSINAMDLFLPLIVNGEIPVIGDTYPREFKTYIESRSDFLNQFDVVQINEISEQEAVRFLVYRSILLEKEFKVFITFGAIRKAVEIAHRYFRSKLLPGSASDLLKEAVVYAQDIKEKILTPEIVIEIAERQSRIPIQKASGTEVDQLLNLEEEIHKKLINQNTAVSSVARSLREYRSGLSRQGGPIASFLFVGPTGVGKTELSKILTKIQFGSKDAMHRFDMSEYQDKQSIFRLIGNPDGSKTGSLTDSVMKEPYSLILLDEFEKAHPDVLNLFLQVFDDGRLSDSLGRTVNFENTIIIATSNAHSDFIKKKIEEGKTIEDIAEELKKKLTEYFRPELINRFSDIIVFRNLSMDEIEKITGLLMGDVCELLENVHGISLSVGKDAIKRISELGFSPVFGARPLRQVISEKIRGVLAEKILKKEIARGNSIFVSLEEGEFIFKVVE